jgi:hypothetical protein
MAGVTKRRDILLTYRPLYGTVPVFGLRIVSTNLEHLGKHAYLAVMLEHVLYRAGVVLLLFTVPISNCSLRVTTIPLPPSVSFHATLTGKSRRGTYESLMTGAYLSSSSAIIRSTSSPSASNGRCGPAER